MSLARLHIHGPIPHPSTWCISPNPEPPAGFMRLAGCSITARAKKPGSDLVPAQDTAAQAVPVLLDRLLAAFAQLDESARVEIIRHAEHLAGAAP